MKGRPEDYLGYDEYLCEKFDMTIEEMYRDHPIFKTRNSEIINIMRMYPSPSKIFEFACTYGFLALEILKQFPNVDYTCTNFLQDVVDYVENQGVKTFLWDATLMPFANMKKYDTFICTSMEHLKNDRFIIKSLPKDSVLYFCATDMNDKTHFWRFRDENEIRDRYINHLKITDLKTIKIDQTRKKVIGRGIINGNNRLY